VKNRNRSTDTTQDPLVYAGTTHRRRAELQNAVASLQRATRRCVKHFGSAAAARLIAVVKRELIAFDGPGRANSPASSRKNPRSEAVSP
jgi:hypothetical protein